MSNSNRGWSDDDFFDQQANDPLPFFNIHGFYPQAQTSLKWGQTLHQVQIALLDPVAWRQRHADQVSGDAMRLERAYEYFQARQRQIAAVLEAHGIPVTFAYCSGAGDARETLSV